MILTKHEKDLNYITHMPSLKHPRQMSHLLNMYDIAKLSKQN